MNASSEHEEDSWSENTAEAFGPDVIERVKKEHPGSELRQFSTSEGAVICKAPSRAEFKRFRTMWNDGGQQRAQAFETLLYGCAVYPDRKGLADLLDRRPGLAETFGSSLASWAGLGEEAVEKKL